MRTGLIVAPGFLRYSRSPPRARQRKKRKRLPPVAAAAVAGGFVAVAAMPNTKPSQRQSFDHVLHHFGGRRRLRPRLSSRSARSRKEQKGETLAEIGEMVEAGHRRHFRRRKARHGWPPVPASAEYAQLFDLPVIQHCEDLNLSKGGVMHEGVYSARLGLKGIPSAAEDTMVSRDLILAEADRRKISRRASRARGEPWKWCARRKRRGLKITAEVTPHHFTLTGCRRRRIRHECEDESAACDHRTMSMPLREGIADGTIDVDRQRPRAASHQSEDAGVRSRRPSGLRGWKRRWAWRLRS